MTVFMMAARNLPLTASVARLHLGRAGLKATSVVLRRCPRPVRLQLSAPVVRHFRPDLAALAVAADGRGPEARAVLSEAIESLDAQESRRSQRAGRPVTSPSRSRYAQAAVVLHDVPLAQRALYGSSDPQSTSGFGAVLGKVPASVAIARSVVAAEQGHLDLALSHLEDVERPSVRGLRDRLNGERQVLRAELLSDVLGTAPRAHRLSQRGRLASTLHVVSGALPEQQSGYTVRTQGILSAQRAAGIDAQAVTRLGFPVDVGVFAASAHVTHEGVPYHHLLPGQGIPVPGRDRQELAVDELATLVRRTRPDLLHAHSKHENAQVALLAARRFGLPVVYEARGFLEETWVSAGGDPSSDFYRWTRESETRCMQEADQVVTISAAMARDIVLRGIPAHRVHVVPNAVPSSFADRPPGAPGADRLQRRAEVRGRLGIPEHARVFGTVTTLNDYEGLDTVIEALALLRDPILRLLIVGTGPSRARLAEHAERRGVSDQVVFTGRVAHSQVRDHLDAMDVFVLPRRDTPVTRLVPPLKPLEAMAVGVPVLASDLPPLVEIVRPGAFGEVVSPSEPAAWAQRMSSWAGDSQRVEETGARAAAFVAAERTWTQATEQYRRIYEGVLNAGPVATASMGPGVSTDGRRSSGRCALSAPRRVGVA